MSEPKRVALTTISTSVSSNAVASAASATLRFGSDFRRGPEKVGGGGGGVGVGVVGIGVGIGNESVDTTSERKAQNNKTIRLNLELFKTDSSTYPEFNYAKLIHFEKKKLKKLKQKSSNGFSDPFETNDDDVARIAKELEAKYGTAYGSGRGRSKKDDHCDIGLGYDESDSFIDNTEAYDEIIPEEVEPIEGGFYINCGALEFKKLYNEPVKSKTDEIIKMPNRPKKRVLSTSSEDSSSSERGENDNDNEDDDEGEKEDDDSSNCKTDATDKTKHSSMEKRHKSNSGTTTVKNKSGPTTQINGGNKKKEKSSSAFSGSSSNSPKPIGDEIGSDSDRERIRQQKTVKTTTVKDMLKAKRDNFLKMQVVAESKNVNGELKASATKSSEDEESSSDESDGSTTNSDSNTSAPPEKKGKKNVPSIPFTEENTEKLRSADTKLPELETEVVTSVHEFRELVKTRGMTGKRFQFDDQLTEVFLKIDESLLCVDKSQRNMVFAHLEFNLLLPKYFFLRKAKQLRVKEEKLKSKRALAKLRKAVIEAMPGAINNYEVELRKSADLQSGSINAEQPPKMPKKKFPWTSELRNLLYDVYQVRWTSYPSLGTRKESLEEFINGYLRDKVVDLWPNGWMRYEELQKEIEKRKASAKKAKSKKKATTQLSNPAGMGNGPNQIGANIVAASPNSLTGSVTYMKQFEEFASSSRSCANSDTDSVASSSGTSGGLKRKTADIQAPNNTKSKSKSQRQTNANEALPIVSEVSRAKPQVTITTVPMMQELMSPTKQLAMHAMSSASMSTATVSSTTAPTTMGGGGLTSLPPPKHSTISTTAALSRLGAPAAHVIDLDNYMSPSDILQTSKQLADATFVPQTGGNIKIDKRQVRRSSSESDGVEIVGVFHAENVTATLVAPNAVVNVPAVAGGKQKHTKRNANNQNNRSVTPIAVAPMANLLMDPNVNMYAAGAGVVTATSKTNNSSGGGNKGRGSNAPSELPEFDITRMINALKTAEDTQKQKSLLTSRNMGAGKDNHHQ